MTLMRFVSMVLAFMVLTGACSPSGDGTVEGNQSENSDGQSQSETAEGEEFPDPRGEEEGTTPTCGSEGIACMQWYEDGDYRRLFDATTQILASPETAEDERAEASVFNAVAALRLQMIDAATAESQLGDVSTEEQLDADVQTVRDEGLLEAYVLQEKSEDAARVVAEADPIVIERFRIARPDLIDRLEALIPGDITEQELAPDE